MELTPDQVNQFVADAVLKSQIGEAVQSAVKRVMEELEKSYSNPFDAVITKHVMVVIDKEVITQYQPLLEAGIKKAMSKWATDEILTKIIESAMDRLKSRY